MEDAGTAESGTSTLALSSNDSAPPVSGVPVRSGWSARGPLWAARVGPPVAFLLASLSMQWHVVRHLNQALPGSSDGILFSWYFEWVAQSIVHGHNPFVSTALNAPAGVNVMWNTAVFLLAVLCIPLTLTIGATTTVALMAVLASAVSASVAYWVLRRLTGSTVGAVLGAAVYGYGPFDVGQFSHLHLILAVFPPLLVLLGHRVLIAQPGSPVRTGVLLGVAVGLQMLLSEELVALCAIATAAGLFWLVVLNVGEVRARFRYAAIAIGIAVGVAAVITAVPLWFQFRGRDALSTFRAATGRADIASLVRPSLLQYYSSRADRAANIGFGAANGAENTAYLGWPLIVAVLAVSIWFIVRRDRFAGWWLLTCATIAVLMFGSPITLDGHRVSLGPWGVLRRLPLFGGVIPVRLSLIILFMVGALIAWTLAKLRGRALAVGVLVAAAVLVPLRPVSQAPFHPLPATPRFFASSAVNAIPRGAITVVFPQAGFPNVQAMLWQIRAHLRFSLVGGYSVFDVNGHGTYFPRLPYFVSLLRVIGKTGVYNPWAEHLATPTVAASGVKFVVITAEQPHMDQVAAAAAVVTGCDPRPVADVLLCQIPG